MDPSTFWSLIGSAFTLLLMGLAYFLNRYIQGTDENTSRAETDRRRIQEEAKRGRQKLWEQVSEIDEESITRDTEIRRSVTELRDHVNAHFVRHRDLEDIKKTLTKIEEKQDKNYQQILSHIMGRD